MIRLSIVLLLAAAPARADTALLANGARVEGILEGAAPDAIRLRVAADGYVLLDPATVTSIEPASPSADAALLARWKRDDRRAAAEERSLRTRRVTVPPPASSDNQDDAASSAPRPEAASPAPVQVVVNNYVYVAQYAAAPVFTPRRRIAARHGERRAPIAQATRGPFDVSGFGAFARPFGL